MKKIACMTVMALATTFGVTATAQQGPPPQAQQGPPLYWPAADKVAKKTAWGHPNLQGMWGPSFIQNLGEDAPMLPENRKKYKSMENVDDPTDSCVPPGVPRVMNLAFPLEIMQTEKVVYILLEYDQSTRRIYLDQELPKDPDPSWLGTSVGRWEGNTLVVKTTGVREETWLDMRGHLHSEKMILTEKFTRSDDNKTLTYEINIDDPTMYSKPWGVTKKHQYRPDMKINEFICETGR